MAEDPGPDRPAPTVGSAPRATSTVGEGTPPNLQARAQALVDALVGTFEEQVRRALELDLDGSTTSLAIIDHYLSLARDEEREPIVSLLAAGAGAYFGELVRREIGGIWIGDGTDPRRLRLLLEPQLIHFSPVDQAYETIAGEALSPDDPRIAAGPDFDSAFGFPPPSTEQDVEDGPEADDTTWLSARLSELSPVPEDQFYSLTCRFETLVLMLEMLAARHEAAGQPPRSHGLADYVEVLAKKTA